MKKVLIFLLRIGVSIGILWFIFSRPDLNLRFVIDALKKIHRPYLYLAAALYCVPLLMGGLRWKLLLRAHEINLSFFRILQLLFIGLFFNGFLPSLTGGDVIKAYYTSKETPKRAEAVMAIIVDRSVGLLALCFLGAIAGIFSLTNQNLRGPALLVISLFAVFFIVFLSAFNPKISEKIFPLHRQHSFSRLKAMLGKLYHAFYFYKSCPAVLIQAFLLSLGLQAITITVSYLLALGLGIQNVAITYFFLFLPIVAVISALPISMAGWGIGEMTYKGCLAFVGVPGGLAVSLSLAFRLVTLAWSLIGLPLYLIYCRPAQERILNVQDA